MRCATLSAVVLIALVDRVSAQCPQTDWACFVEETSSRLVLTSDSPFVDGDPDPLDDDTNDEMDIDCADVDLDGDPDCAMVYKQLGTTIGQRRNWLFMNENGVLMDRTGEYASASNVAGDLGFLTLTNDRDVVIVDVTGDGWPEIITAVTLSGGPGGTTGTKHISHPRIYLNLADDPPGSGDWQGFLYDDPDRVPTMPAEPRFSSVSAGDIDGDGDQDLYFSDHQQGPYGRPEDLNDRLWINDGTGYFADESSARMTAQMLESSFGMATAISDMNGDGRLDIVKDDAINAPQAISVSYNNLNGATTDGFFNGYQLAYQFTPYYVSTPDLNGDGKLDIIVSDDSQAYFKLNNGNLPSGMVSWLPSQNGRYLMGGAPNQFDGDNGCADLDNDGWPDCWVTSVDEDLPSCTTRGYIFHNSGAPEAGGVISLAYGGDLGIALPAYQGSHDFFALDLNEDGWMDLIMGTCYGTFVYINHSAACATLGDCADLDADGVRDDGCMWWSCAAGECQGVPVGFADLGGAFGACEPDGVTDSHDRFHALNCFSNSNTSGAAGYPCEAAPPQAFNVDAGGPFGACQPDGVCDANDAFHALNAFEGLSSCTCPAGPAPVGHPLRTKR